MVGFGEKNGVGGLRRYFLAEKPAIGGLRRYFLAKKQSSEASDDRSKGREPPESVAEMR